MRVWLSPSELSARGLTVQDVQQAIRSRNVEVPAGRIESERREFTVRSLGELKTPEEFGNLVVSITDRSNADPRRVAEMTPTGTAMTTVSTSARALKMASSVAKTRGRTSVWETS